MSAIDTPWWSHMQLARRYRVTRQTIYAWIREGRLPAPMEHPSGMGSYWLESQLPPVPNPEGAEDQRSARRPHYADIRAMRG